MHLLTFVIVLFVALAAPGVVLTREPLKQCIALSFYGLLFAILFFVYQAPDVALSQITAGAVLMPAIILFALVKMRHQNLRRPDRRPHP